MEEDNPLGLGYTPTVGDAFEGAVNYLGGVARFYQKTVPQFFTGVRRGIKEEAEAPSPITDTLNPIQAAGELTTAYSQAESTALEQVASGVESLGLPEPVAGAAALAVSPFLPGPAEMGLVMKGGAATLLGAVTTTDQPILKAVGVKTGQNIVTPQQGRRLIRRDTEIERLKGSIQQSNEQLDALLELQGDPDNLNIFLNDNPEVQQLMGMYEGRPDQIKRVANRLRERRMGAQESLSRQQSNVLPFDETDPNFFRSKEGLAAKKDEEVRRNITGYLEQHHLFPKGISAAFFGKMDDLISKGKADKDDLIVMAEYAVKQGKRTGDVRSNLINMQKDPHNELHTMLRASGAELGKTDYVRSLKDVKDVNELMRRWRDMLDADVAYNVDTAKVWEPLDDLIKEVRASK